MEDVRDRIHGFLVRNQCEDNNILIQAFKLKHPEWTMTREDLDLFVDLHKVVESMKNAKKWDADRLQEEYDKLVVVE